MTNRSWIVYRTASLEGPVSLLVAHVRGAVQTVTYGVAVRLRAEVCWREYGQTRRQRWGRAVSVTLRCPPHRWGAGRAPHTPTVGLGG